MTNRSGYTDLLINLEELINLEYDGAFTQAVAEITSLAYDEYVTESWQKERGIILFNKLLPPGSSKREAFHTALEFTPKVRLRLCYPASSTEQAKLLKIPWEYCYCEDPSPASWADKIKAIGFIARHPRLSLVHTLAQSTKATPIVDQLPIQTVYLDAIPPNSEEEYNYFYRDIENEFFKNQRPQIARLDRLRSITQTKPPLAEMTDLRAAIKNYHIIQLVSHGDERFIYIPDIENKGDLRVGLEQLQGAITQAPHLKAVVLGTCNGAVDPVGLAPSLHRIGIPIIVGMTSSIKTRTVRWFLGNFYATLMGDLVDIETAMVWARLATITPNPHQPLSTPKLQEFSFDWGLPRLFLATEGSDLIAPHHLYLSQDECSQLDQKYQPLFTIDQPSTPSCFDTASKDCVETVENRMAYWLKESIASILYLSGTTNTVMAKTIARMIKQGATHKEDLIYHFCLKNDAFVNNPVQFSRVSLYPQFEALYGAETVRGYLKNGVYPVEATEAVTAFFDLVITPLQQAQVNQSKKPIIIVTGLDEAVESYPHCSILDLLIHYQYQLRQTVRLLITATSHSLADKRIQTHLLNPHEREVAISFLITNNAFNLDKQNLIKVPKQKKQERLSTLFLTDQYHQTLAQQQAQILLNALTVTTGPVSISCFARCPELPSQVDQIYQLVRKQLFQAVDTETLPGHLLFKPNISLETPPLLPLSERHDLFVEMFQAELIAGTWSPESLGLCFEYVRQSLYQHAFIAYQYSLANGQSRRQRANRVLQLVANKQFREIRMGQLGHTCIEYYTPLEDIRMALQVIFIETMMPHTAPLNALKTVNHLLNAYNKIENHQLITLEKNIRQHHNTQQNIERLFMFLQIKPWENELRDTA